VVDLVESTRTVYVRGHVVIDVFEACIVLQVSDVLHTSGAEVVHTDHAVALKEEPLAQMAPDKPGPTRN
jgi:hypothetical protein